MLTSVFISVIVGTVCVLFAIFYKMKARFKIILAIAGAAFLLYGGFGYGVLRPKARLEVFHAGNRIEIDYPVKKVQIISPVQGDTVKCRILTMGVYPDSHENDIWVLLKPSDNKYYPQSDYTNTSYKEDGKWQVVTRFGGDQGELYNLYVYETDSIASSFFSETISNWKATNDYVGLQQNEIPKGATKIDSLQLILENNCRGIH